MRVFAIIFYWQTFRSAIELACNMKVKRLKPVAFVERSAQPIWTCTAAAASDCWQAVATVEPDSSNGPGLIGEQVFHRFSGHRSGRARNTIGSAGSTAKDWLNEHWKLKTEPPELRRRQVPIFPGHLLVFASCSTDRYDSQCQKN